MTDISITRKAGDEFRPEPGATREEGLSWNTQQLVGDKGSLTIGTTSFSRNELQAIRFSKMSPALAAKVAAVGGREKLFALLDDLLTGAAKSGLTKSETRHILISTAVSTATTGDFKVQVSPTPFSGAPVLPPGPQMGSVSTAKPLGGPSGWGPLFPNGPFGGVKLNRSVTKPEGWKHDLPGQHPSAGGGVSEQLYQATKGADLALRFSIGAITPLNSTGRAEARSTLSGLKPTPTLTGSPVSVSDYESRISSSSPSKVFAAVTKDLGAVFAKAGIVIAPMPVLDPALGPQYTVRFFVLQGVPPIAAAVEMRIDMTTRTLRAQTLDGHPLRGINEWKFEDDGKGGTIVRQHSEFQMSHGVGELVNQYVMPGEQAWTWQKFHGAIGVIGDA